MAAWRETDLFTDEERAALALAESMTRLADRADAGPRRGVARSGKALRREAAGRPGPVGRHDQPVQPDQRRDQAACRRRLVTVRAGQHSDASRHDCPADLRTHAS